MTQCSTHPTISMARINVAESSGEICPECKREQEGYYGKPDRCWQAAVSGTTICSNATVNRYNKPRGGFGYSCAGHRGMGWKNAAQSKEEAKA
jgi:hypothetical protein